MERAGQFIVAFTLGALTGVATGLLMAPDKGEKTRKRLGKQYNKAYKRTVDDVDDFLDDTINRLDDLRSAATDSIDDLSKKVDELAKNKR